MSFESNIQNMYGAKGEVWLASLPHRITEISQKYNLSKLTPASNLSYNYVAFGFQIDQPIVLKLGINASEINQEADALTAFSGYGAVKVIAAENTMLLLEQVIPGTSLKSYFPSNDSDAIQIACNVMQKLHQAPVPSSKFPHMCDWLKVLDKDWNIPKPYLHRARHLGDNLLETITKTVLLHGDLHHDNILQHGDSWIAIDPKGIIGEPAYEVAAFIRNPIPQLLDQSNVESIIHTRILQFAILLNVPPHRILDWCFVQSILCWAWALDDNCSPEYFIHLGALLNRLHF